MDQRVFIGILVSQRLHTQVISSFMAILERTNVESYEQIRLVGVNPVSINVFQTQHI